MKFSKPRVTDILRAVGLSKDYSGVDTFYRDRGVACHAAIHLYLMGQLDESSIDESYRGHFEGFKKWWGKAEGQGKIDSELHLENEDYQGTLDLLYAGVLWDFKCSKSHDKVAEIQGAGYKKLLGMPEIPFRVIQLPGDGTFELIEYKSPIALWDAVWRVFCWRKGRKYE